MDTQTNRASLDAASALATCLRLGITEHDIARVSGVSLDAVREWVEREIVPSGEQAERLESLASLVVRLERLIAPASISPWFATPMPALGGATPLDRVASGEHRAVARLVSGLEDPGAS
jgi:transcriptional regulator with XRE-family HTH domain